MSEKNYVINVKTKIGTIFTVRADTVAELKENIRAVIAESIQNGVFALEELLTDTAPAPTAEQVVLNSLGGQVITQPQPTSAPTPAPTPAPVAQNAGPVCRHGAMTHRNGVSKTNGKPWSGYFCPQPAGASDKCDTIWGK